MMTRTENAKFTNMCMIYDEKGNVLVQSRKMSWCGLAFPGGHFEPKESIVDFVIREVKEETVLDICEVKLCGIKQAFPQHGGRYIVFLYKTNKFKGKLKSNSEGENSWIKVEDLMKRKNKMANNFEYMLQVFLNDEYSEHYHLRNDDRVIDLLK